ncbi:tyrosine-type recombinase/integrase [Singulisphaera sp. Ch08]|uniref:tyrosine-type recombinase/integrase n=1 Tax=Singulisphaera sp. Ch08 TaxID=3120278 RepID=UPI003873330D
MAVERAGKVRDLAVARLLLNTRLRIQELQTLTWKDVARSDRKGLLTGRHDKRRERRRVSLNHDARPALTAVGYLQHAGDGAVILRGVCGPITPRGIQVASGQVCDLDKSR